VSGKTHNLSQRKGGRVCAEGCIAFFGLKTLKEASEIQEGDSSGLDEELEEAKTAVQESQTVKQSTTWYVYLFLFVAI
jgi:hypothetical protein